MVHKRNLTSIENSNLQNESRPEQSTLLSLLTESRKKLAIKKKN